jgi:hypothetical protein
VSVHRWELARRDVKVTLTRSIVEGGPEKGRFWNAESVWSKSLFLSEGLLSGFAREASMTCSGRNLLLCLYHFPNDASFHASGFLVQDTGVLKLDVVNHHPGLNETPSVSNVDLTTLAGYAVNSVLKLRSSLMGQRKHTLPRQEPYSFDAMSY